MNDLGGAALPRRGATINRLAATEAESNLLHLPTPLTYVPAEDVPRRPAAAALAARRPRASLIIPTHARAELLSRCVASCFDLTDYGPLELIVIDHASKGDQMAAALDSIAGRSGAIVVREEGPFNYSRLINIGVARTDAELIILLNDDVEATTEDWLLKLVTMLEQPGIGIVGPRLLYPDGRIQHDGVALGFGGLAGHPGRGSRPDDRNPYRVDPWPRTVSAVTGACLLMRRRDFYATGGMDESLAVEFNDVDLCLRVAARGLRCVVDPRVTLVHHENASRVSGPPGALVNLSDRTNFTNRWGHVLGDDPWFTPNLAIEHESCGLANPPRTHWDLAPRRRQLAAQPRSCTGHTP
jgi:GT2 family glycosyltransferase